MPLRVCVTCGGPFVIGAGVCPTTQEDFDNRDIWIRDQINTYLKGALAHQGTDCHFLPQSNYVSPNVNQRWVRSVWGGGFPQKGAQATAAAEQGLRDSEPQSCNFVLRFESLAEDMAAFTKWIGAEVPAMAAVHNSYVTLCNSTVSEETKALAYKTYTKDYVQFGYNRNHI